MRKHIKFGAFLCGILSFALFLDCANPQRYKMVYAGDQVTYLSDVKLFEGDKDSARASCQNNGYTFYAKDVNSGTGKKSVYLGYKTSTDKKDAIYDVKLLAMDGVELEFGQDALRALAKEAIRRKTGARGLRAAMERVMTDIMYEAPGKAGSRKVSVTADMVAAKL